MQRNRSIDVALAVALGFALPSCTLFVRSGDARLAELRAEVGGLLLEVAEGARVTSFEADAPDETSLSRLRETLEYWDADLGGEPRWRDVLQPDRPTLYRELLALIAGGETGITLEAYPFDAIGADFLSLVVYRRANGDAVGWDYTSPSHPAPPPPDRGFVGYDDLRWWEYPHFLLDLPVYAAIGIKELAFEVVKAPLSFLDVSIVGALASQRVPLVSPQSLERGGAAFLEDLDNGLQGLLWRFRVRARHTPLDLLQDLAGAIPLLGHYFAPRAPRVDDDPPRPVSHFVISGGIFHGSDDQQLTEPWRREIAALRPDAEVFASPDRHGGFLDVTWSLANLSHGYAYDLAGDIAFHQDVAPGAAVEIVGHSGGVQRGIVASRLLRLADIDVAGAWGIAGPSFGPSAARKSTVLLTSSWSEDPTATLGRVLPSLFFFMPSNVAIDLVPGGGPHRKLFFPNGFTRAPEDGYAERFRMHLEGPAAAAPAGLP